MCCSWHAQRGKRVVVYLPEGASTSGLYVASAAERVLLGPETFVSPLGYAVEAQYFKDALDRVGVEPEVFARGRYKTAGEMLVSRSMSDAQREQLDALLDVAWDTLVDALATGRGVERGIAEQWINSGPWSADSAVAQHIADARGVRRSSSPELLSTRGSKDGAPLIGAGRYLARRRIRWRPLRRPRVHRRGRGPRAHRRASPRSACCRWPQKKPVSRLPSSERSTTRACAAWSCTSIRAVAARSPRTACCTSSSASRRRSRSSRTWATLRRAAATWSQSARRRSWPSPRRLPGRSASSPRASSSARCSSGSASASKWSSAALAPTWSRRSGTWTKASAKSLERQLDDVYRSFLRVVSEGRRRPLTEIEPLAGGRVWSGRDALARGLVDRLGGFDTALEEVRARIGRGGARLQPELVSGQPLPLAMALLPRLLGGSARMPQVLGTLPLAPLMLAAARERVWMWCGIEELDLGGR